MAEIPIPPKISNEAIAVVYAAMRAVRGGRDAAIQITAEFIADIDKIRELAEKAAVKRSEQVVCTPVH